ncbi:MAG: sugar phosphate isomerase/epimerase [Acidaminococcus sp.]|jgi:sugar phosphate isomerase/epimerase|nr:sugar phosphate isomerase/epimerase [Acidaminococcus sp.]MCI2099480.1 sugar phosphate isomerase/epimerase [Acidaminococcus sp.]MCI2113840.1 sugar phosphate isomerase/epimerase [Acidaminococcus sp.]MCI2115586.1 sugar phosphate isomerase/epimerase [Acidaminococcus sp.]
MKSKVYASSSFLWGVPLEELFRVVHECGFSGIEMWAQQFFDCGYDEEEYRRLAEFYHLGTTVHSVSWDLNLSSINDAVREASIGQVKESIELCRRINGEDVTVHPGHMTMTCFKKMSIELMRDSLLQIAEISKQRNVLVSLEVMEKVKKEFVTNAEAMKQVTGSLSDFFTYTIDVAHCDSTVEIDELASSLPSYSKFHISNRKGKTYHTSLDDGDFDFRWLLPRLLLAGKKLVLEGYDDSPNRTKLWHNAAYLASIIPDAMTTSAEIIMNHFNA